LTDLPTIICIKHNGDEKPEDCIGSYYPKLRTVTYLIFIISFVPIGDIFFHGRSCGYGVCTFKRRMLNSSYPKEDINMAVENVKVAG
jgi:hypothetical protein